MRGLSELSGSAAGGVHGNLIVRFRGYAGLAVKPVGDGTRQSRSFRGRAGLALKPVGDGTRQSRSFRGYAAFAVKPVGDGTRQCSHFADALAWRQ